MSAEGARIRSALATFIVRVAGPFLIGAAAALVLLAMLPEVGA